MSRKRKKSRATTQQKPNQQKQDILPIEQTNSSTSVSIGGKQIKKILTLAGGLATVFALVFAVWTYYYPKISVSSGPSLAPEHAISAPSFVISNDGNGSLRNVSYYLGFYVIDYITDYPPHDHIKIWGNKKFQMHLKGSDNNVSVMRPGEKYTVLSPAQSGPPYLLNYADVAVIVDFEPEFVPVRMRKMSRFVTNRDTEGRIYWSSQPIEKDIPIPPN